ncbi:MAG: hypothetical protein J2P48_04935 [Alphaproteobacteria bacterium]|nr:hypothetical protein [Alphaproteobacteria bacterium]
MTGDILLVGSVPLDTVEQVFRTVGRPLGPFLAYMPDGEVGDRRYWIDGIAYRVLNGHPEIETLGRPAPDQNGVEQWRPQGIHDQFRFRVKPGVETVRFGDPGWRLGYTKDAVNSYFVFRQLKKEGVLPAALRLQVCLPLTNSAVTLFFPDPADHVRIVPGFTAALRAEVAKIIELIAPAELAIQWDLAVENRYVEAALERDGIDAAKREAERLMAPAREISPRIPEAAALGYHSCFGTLDGWPSRQPRDLTGSVILLNAAVAASGRRVDFLHLPTLGSAEDAFFAPLGDLQAGSARVYLGAIHHMHAPGGLQRQLRAARKYLPRFGIAAPCGFGRVPERPGRFLTEKGSEVPRNYLEIILRDHLAAVEQLRDVMKD